MKKIKPIKPSEFKLSQEFIDKGKRIEKEIAELRKTKDVKRFLKIIPDNYFR